MATPSLEQTMNEEDCLRALSAFEQAGRQYKRTAEILGLSCGKAAKARVEVARARGLHLDDSQRRVVAETGANIANVPYYWDKSENISAMVRNPEYRGDVEKDFEEYCAEIAERLEGIPRAKPPSVRHLTGNLLPVIHIPDWHAGMLSWSKETGKNYNIEIACQKLIEVTEDLTERCAPSHEAAFVFLGDMFHAEDGRSQTYRSGNALDTDTRPAKVALEATEAACRAIEIYASKHKLVKVRILPGNHDPHIAMWFATALKMRYKDSDRVEVIWNPAKLQVQLFGRTLIAWHHGDGGNPRRLTDLVNWDYREEWGAARFCYGHRGHDHSAKKEAPHPGMPWETHWPICTADAFAKGEGYVTVSGASCIEYHPDLGERSRHLAPIFYE